MNRSLASSCLLAACVATVPAHASDIVLTMNAYENIRIGMPLAEVHRLLQKQGRAPLPSPVKTAKKGCGWYTVSNELRFMTQDGKLVRIETAEPNVVTPSGIRVGTSLEKVRHALGSRVEETAQPRSKDPGDRSLVLVSGDREYAIRVDANRQVTRLVVGTAQAVQPHGACSR